MNKHEKRYQKMLKELIKKSFPKLRGKKILIYESDNKKFKSYFADTGYFIFFWRIRTGKKLRKLPDEFLKGILAHELSHIEIFGKRNFIRKIISGLKYFISRVSREKEEKSTDRMAIEKGYGKELYSFRKYNLSVADKKTKERIRKYYLFPEEIKKHMKK